MTLNDTDTFYKKKDKDDKDRPPERDVIIMDDEMYAQIFNNGDGGPDKPWMIAFVRKKRSREEYFQSAFVTNSMKVLAEQYQGRV